MSEWVRMDVRHPPFGSPVIIDVDGTVQYITYSLEGNDIVPDWFEPYYFGGGEPHLIVKWGDVVRWLLVDDDLCG